MQIGGSIKTRMSSNVGYVSFWQWNRKKKFIHFGEINLITIINLSWPSKDSWTPTSRSCLKPIRTGSPHSLSIPNSSSTTPSLPILHQLVLPLNPNIPSLLILMSSCSPLPNPLQARSWSEPLSKNPMRSSRHFSQLDRNTRCWNLKKSKICFQF